MRPPKGTKATSRAIRWRYARSSWCAAPSLWNSAAASPRSPSATKKVTGKASIRCRRYRRRGLICASTLVVRPSSTRCGSCTFRTPTSPPQPSTDKRISLVQPSTVTPASRRRSSRPTHPSMARTSTTGWVSAPHTSQTRQNSARHVLRMRQASQP